MFRCITDNWKKDQSNKHTRDTSRGHELVKRGDKAFCGPCNDGGAQD